MVGGRTVTTRIDLEFEFEVDLLNGSALTADGKTPVMTHLIHCTHLSPGAFSSVLFGLMTLICLDSATRRCPYGDRCLSDTCRLREGGCG